MNLFVHRTLEETTEIAICDHCLSRRLAKSHLTDGESVLTADDDIECEFKEACAAHPCGSEVG